MRRRREEVQGPDAGVEAVREKEAIRLSTSGFFVWCARHGAKRQTWRTIAHLKIGVWPTRVDARRQKSRDNNCRYDNRRAKASREVTRRCKSSGGPDGRELLAEQQLRRREAGWEGSCRQILGSRNTKRIMRHQPGGRGGQNTRSPMAIRTALA